MRGGLERLAAALADRYRVERELGQGGMATVYLAHDIRHDRRVALKVLRPELSAILGPERFLAEIKTTANLQHPHILSLFDSGEADGLVFYVMPFVEGESLRDRLTREKQLPVDEAVRIAREVADALEYAHQKGIIHRDIKPENILLHGGHAMVADFGIALAAVRSTGSTRLTETGLSLGTPHYMAPEQAMGQRDITTRADIYALGCVLYEMLVAEPPFKGANAQAIIARVMTEEPRSLTLQRRTVPPHVEAAVMTALSKLPADRFASAAQFAAALGNPGYASAATLHQTAFSAAAKSPRARLIAALPWALLAVTGGILVWSWLTARAPSPPPVLRLGLELPSNALWEDQPGATMALSPDGTRLVYNGRDSTGTHLFLRMLDRLDPMPVGGTGGGTHPSFSPDGGWIGFYKEDKFYRTPVTGGSPELVCSVTGRLSTYTWLDARSIVVADSGGLKQCSMAGAITVLYRPADSASALWWPHALPRGRGILYTVTLGATSQLGVYDARSRSARSLGIAGTNPRYVAAGYLLYTDFDGIVRAVPFDVDHLRVTGDPTVVMQGVRVGGGGTAKMAVSLNGTMVTTVGQSGERTLELVDRRGVAERLPVPAGRYSHPRFSPDGSQVAVAVGDLSSNIWLLDRRQGTLTRLTSDSGASRPTWTPDGKRIVFSRVQGLTADLRIINADGSAPAESLLTVPGLQILQSRFTPDGRALVARTTGPTGGEIWRVPLDSTRVLRPLLHGPVDVVGATLSPDGRWMAYVSRESGRWEVYVRSFPGMGARYQVSLDGGLEPVWSPRGNEIFYRNGSAMLSAAVRTSPGFEVLGRTTLFADPAYRVGVNEPEYDLTPDGQRLLMVRLVGTTSGLAITLNWFDNLQAGRVGGVAGAEAQ